MDDKQKNLNLLNSKADKQKIQAYDTGFDIRILCNRKGVGLKQFNATLQNYHSILRDKTIIKDYSLLSQAIKFNFCELEITVSNGFKIYNELISIFKPPGLKEIGSNVYDPINSQKFAPSQLNNEK